ncbi:putative cppB [Mycobacterium xenopi 4042]|uniref:Putative cppB n=1 Tax=Mycobacterium xenopi 4042 TaxID=1299334 RepID=X8AN79_MYCXE|nr:putative cppB [Mycobacterium xenopi 4042]
MPDGRIPVLLSAHEPDLVGRDAAAILRYVQRLEPGVPAVAATLLRLRRVRRHRAVVRAADRAELAAALSKLADGDEHPLVATSSIAACPRIAFVCPVRATSGRRWVPTPIGSFRPTGPRPTIARRRSSRPDIPRHCPTYSVAPSRIGRRSKSKVPSSPTASAWPKCGDPTEYCPPSRWDIAWARWPQPTWLV